MEITQQSIEFGLLILGALLGAFKGTTYYDAGKSIAVRLLDACVGTYVGVIISYHYASQLSIWYACILSVVAGASGAMIVEVLLKLLPGIIKDLLKSWLERVVGTK